jgi:diaminohydroxyphosphoribosylaminopyrimidine deaminase / 5-amino-6-(5-phosphoribosylamino)uracil reductase
LAVLTDENFINRCFQLAKIGAGNVSPNPLVGAVLVHRGKIIGEGWHKKYGDAHAEVNCLASVLPENQRFVTESTLFCNLEPCHHFGKTPPCVDLILENKIPCVVISNLDPNPLTAGKSVDKLQKNGVEVKTGILQKEGEWLNRAFFIWINKKRPYIVLKWAETADGYIGRVGARTTISNPFTQRLTHRWRSESDAILVGTNTAITDNPSLTNRFFFGKNPLRIVVDFEEKVPKTHQIFDETAETWLLKKTDKSLIINLLERLSEAGKTILFVEGGANLIQQFIDAELWDEARIFQSEKILGSGVRAPKLASARLVSREKLGGDLVTILV